MGLDTWVDPNPIHLSGLCGLYVVSPLLLEMFKVSLLAPAIVQLLAAFEHKHFVCLHRIQRNKIHGNS